MSGKRKIKKEWVSAYAFIAPLTIGTVIFGIIPIFWSFILSFTKWDGLGAKQFIGFENYTKLLSDSNFLLGIRNTMVYTFTSVPISIFLAMIIANLLNKGIKLTGFYRVVYFLPNVVMPVAVAMIWKFLLNSQTGIVNQFLGALHLPTPGWTTDPNYILVSLIIISVWSGIGYNIIILLSALQGISHDLCEAARIDGADGNIIFWKITVPMLTPSLFFLITTGIMNAMRVFDIVYMFLGSNTSGPLLKASRTMVYGIYTDAFKFMHMGYASAESVILFVFILIVTAVQFVLQKKWVFYQ